MNLRRARDLSLITACTAFGCSWLVDPHEGEPRCAAAQGDPERCPQGTQCIDGRCEPICGIEYCGDRIDNDCDGQMDEHEASMLEVCGDGIDNDCDGEPDEPNDEPDVCGDQIDNNCNGQKDEGSDNDEDRFAWCGNTRETGALDTIDCDDFNAARYPGALEVCDGLDNNCDGQTDEQNQQPGPALCNAPEECIDRHCAVPGCGGANAAVTCGRGQRCDVQTRSCVPAQACDDMSCGVDEICDSQTRRCRRRFPNGTGCESDDDCRSNTCFDAAALRLGNGMRICGEACCDDSQCPSGERCFASGTGARSCVPADWVPDTVLRQCTTDAACTSTEVCGINGEQRLASFRFEPHDPLTTSTCRAPSLIHPVGTPCLFDLECDSKVCVPRTTFSQRCTAICGTSRDCAEFEAAAISEGTPARAYCRYTSVGTTEPRDYASICVYARDEETGPGQYGAPCMKPEDCLEHGCVGATTFGQAGRCAPTCCHKSQCGSAENGREFSCRAYAFGTNYEMRCEI